jgi:hypothetical protein
MVGADRQLGTLILIPAPQGGLRKTPLKLPWMLAEHEREIPSSEEGEVRAKQRIDSLRAGKEPAVARRMLGEPGKRRGEKELSAGVEQSGEPFEECHGIGNPIEEIGGEDEIEALFEGGGERVAHSKFDPLRADAGGNGKFPLHELITLHRNRTADRACLLKQAGGLEKSLGEVQSHHASTAPGELEAGTTDCAAEFESRGMGRKLFPTESFLDAADGKVGRLRRASGIRELPFGRSIMENQILGEGGARLVEVGTHSARPRSFRK